LPLQSAGSVASPFERSERRVASAGVGVVPSGGEVEVGGVCFVHEATEREYRAERKDRHSQVVHRNLRSVAVRPPTLSRPESSTKHVGSRAAQQPNETSLLEVRVGNEHIPQPGY